MERVLARGNRRRRDASGPAPDTMDAVSDALPDHLQVADRMEAGRAARKVAPRSSHADWDAGAPHRSPVDLVEEQNATRLPWLVPVRHGRMAVSPFTFYRKAARVMASDLSATPDCGLTVQVGGDAHLSNFGTYASPERRLVFDANDFDETLPGPWEWDVKRLAASVAIAARHIGADDAAVAAATKGTVTTYRLAMREFSAVGNLDLFHRHMDIDDIRTAVESQASAAARKQFDKFEAKARSHDNLQALRKLTVEVDGKFRIKSTPPVLLPLREAPIEADVDSLHEAAVLGFSKYLDTLQDDRRALVERYTPVDVGVKVVGVGSVGTRCLIMLLEGRDRGDPLFLQIKEADPSVLEEFLGPSRYPNHGQRVVEGQRITQAVSDVFLGWTDDMILQRHHFYVRQLRDWKGSFEVDSADVRLLSNYAALCGWTLARGHARSGDAVAISAYLGTGDQSDTFDRAVTAFCLRYAERNAEYFDEFTAAISDGRLRAEFGV